MSAVALKEPAGPRLLPASYPISLTLIGALALVSQILCYRFGLYAVSMDESVRALMSADLTFARALEPLKSGDFASADAVHDVKGSVQLRGAGDRLSLRFTNYDATSGPDVFFYLAHDGTFDPAKALKVRVPDGGTEGQATLRGNFSVPVEGAHDPNSYSRLVVWCERFGGAMSLQGVPRRIFLNYSSVR